MINNSCSTSTEESDYMPDEFVISFSEDGELEFSNQNVPKEREVNKDDKSSKKRKVLKKRGRKRNSLRRSFTLLEGNDLYFNGYNPDYIICEPIDSINNSCMCNGIDRITNEKVSIKIIDMNDENAFQKAKKELMILKTIGGKNSVVNVKASFSDNQMLHIVQHFPIDTLVQRVTKNMPDNKIKNMVKQMIDCIEFIHKSGIVHGNLSPKSIFYKYNDKDDIYVSDFSDSISLSSITGNSYPLKSNQSIYCSPEQLSSRVISKDHLSKLDVWSLGVIIFFSVYGKNPFSNINEIIKNDINKDLLLDKKEFNKLISICLNKDPIKRPFISDISKDSWIHSK
eukprot:TRINITY_DN10532_c0_g1_i1.p1 TRINITY_DN10532_c0_g1~~TRINITY_DN10532_c0_g1_i1.p1  ORF type:complete len:340 (+),score=83.02 TRINITY_DN10532_c0_g1_i1:90-1109(+)